MTDRAPGSAPSGWERAQTFAAIATAFVAVAAAITAFAEYRSAQAVTRATVALDFLEEFETDGYRDDFFAIEAEIRKIGPSIALANDLSGDALAREIGLNVLLDSQDRVDRLIYFFEKTAICVQTQVCSKSVVESYFKGPADALWEYFGEYIQSERTFRGNFAASFPW